MFDITAAASAASTPGPNLAKSAGLKPTKGELSCVLGWGVSSVAGLESWGAL